MRLNILKEKLSVLQKLQIQKRNIVKSKKNTTEIISEKKEVETKIPQFMTS